jgi:predicted TIM-barrel fold metal-dependent hydrolase
MRCPAFEPGGSECAPLGLSARMRGFTHPLQRPFVLTTFQHKKEITMIGKIAFEEHIESPDFVATGSHNFTDSVYFAEVQHRLQEYKLRLEDMDAMGIETTILSLTQPGVEGITDKNKAIDTARRTNDHIAEFFVANNPGRFLGFATVPLQDPKAAAKELERAVTHLGFKGALINGYTNIGNENKAQYLDEAPVYECWERVDALDVPARLGLGLWLRDGDARDPLDAERPVRSVPKAECHRRASGRRPPVHALSRGTSFAPPAPGNAWQTQAATHGLSP